MKYRTDFVTNSSSSSYVLAFHIKDYSDEILEQYPELRLFKYYIQSLAEARCYYGTEPGTIINNVEALEEFCLKECSFGDIDTIDALLENDTWFGRWYEDALKALEEGFVLIKDVGYGDSLNELIHEFAKYKLLDILYED